MIGPMSVAAEDSLSDSLGPFEVTETVVLTPLEVIPFSVDAVAVELAVVISAVEAATCPVVPIPVETAVVIPEVVTLEEVLVWPADVEVATTVVPLVP